MQWKTAKLIPLLTGAVLGLVCLVQALSSFVPRFDLFQRLECMTYDWRVRLAIRFPAPAAPNLGFVFMDDDTVAQLSNGLLAGESYGLLWPRLIYGRLVRELSSQGAKAIGFDVLFGELRPDHPSIEMADHTRMASDAFFAQQIQVAGNVILAAERDVVPHELFRKNAWAIGDISNEADSDGILRRVKAVKDYRLWNPVFKELARQNDWKVILETPRVIFVDPVSGKTNLLLEIDSNGFFQTEDLTGESPGSGFVHLAPAYTTLRVWHMGLVLAARELNLDLEHSAVELDRHRIRLIGTDGKERRIIPLDSEGRFLVDWSLTAEDARLTKSNLENLLLQDLDRAVGQVKGLTNRWKDKLVVIGSAATGSNLADLGAAPLESKTFSAGALWNVANSVLRNRFITQYSYQTELLLILALGLLSAVLTWKLRPPWSSLCVILLSMAYLLSSVFLYVRLRYWLPIILPVAGALCMTHVCSVALQFLLEQEERRRVRSVFAKIVSPDVVNELLNAKTLSLGGARRRATVFFADVRGFTEVIELRQAKVDEQIQQDKLAGRHAEAYSDQAARETLATVNLYLATVADIVKLHRGTLDKYIGDCVMAFWGAPIANNQHALCCVRAAIDAQRAIHRINHLRDLENKRREKENERRMATSQPPVPLLSLLSLGTGINTGMMIAGLMGSDAHLLNYTVFGREVNLASRLEGISGQSRILIGEATYEELRQHDLQLASICVPQAAVMVKGIRNPVKSYEVLWKPTDSRESASERSAHVDSTSSDSSFGQ